MDFLSTSPTGRLLSATGLLVLARHSLPLGVGATMVWLLLLHPNVRKDLYAGLTDQPDPFVSMVTAHRSARFPGNDHH
jgi:hypothetical protein